VTSVVKVRSQENLSFVEESPIIDDREASEEVYLFSIVARESKVSIRNAHKQQVGQHGQEDGRWHPERVGLEPRELRASIPHGRLGTAQLLSEFPYQCPRMDYVS
jgi:hypothetical protein